MKVLVLGGGVIGVTTAYYLNRQGHEVEVVERLPWFQAPLGVFRPPLGV